MAMYAVLEIASGPQRGKTAEVRPGQTLKVGRHDQADLVIRDDAMMSNVHFTLECDGQRCRVRDLKSRFGTTLNGTKFAEAEVRDGDWIVAGTTGFVVRFAEANVPSPLPPSPASAPVAAPAEPPMGPIGQPRHPAAGDQVCHDRIVGVLRDQQEPLFVLLDAARDPLVLARLLGSSEECLSLYEGPQGAVMAAFGPFLASLPRGTPLLETLVREGWGKSWGVYLTCTRPLTEVRKHFRRFLMVKSPAGRPVYFRFYDPRVLRVFITVCNTRELEDFFGPVDCFLLENDDSSELLSYKGKASGWRIDKLPLAKPK